MMKLIIALMLLTALQTKAQFEPAAGQAGSTAIYKDSSVFKNWASSCTIIRGYGNITSSASFVTVGNESSAIGKAGQNGVVSLGDGGSAILTFNQPVRNGQGFDFAVFENGFRETGSLKDYLEYAFVEVSSDGINYFRFPAEYAGDTISQVSSYATTNTENYHNLAGKYWSGYGTPFDLEELKDIPLLDIENVTHLKITDVIGTINSIYASRDSKGRKINDPYPTDFGSGGFDLDAVGVIHQAEALRIFNADKIKGFGVYPNPSSGYVYIQSGAGLLENVKIADIAGKIIVEKNEKSSGVEVSDLKAGSYTLSLCMEGKYFTEKLIIY